MYDIGDYVVYGHNGICRVEDITNPGFSGVDKDKKYYVLQPLNTKESSICGGKTGYVRERRLLPQTNGI